MIVKNDKMEKVCSFYVSDFHLEMILMPFINQKIDKKENIVIKTEYDLENSLETLLSKMNLKSENKEKIFDLGWNKDKDKNIKDGSNVIIIGSKNYIENINSELEQHKFTDITVVDCYKFNEIEKNMNEIVSKYDGNLNTSGFIEKNSKKS